MIMQNKFIFSKIVADHARKNWIRRKEKEFTHCLKLNPRVNTCSYTRTYSKKEFI